MYADAAFNGFMKYASDAIKAHKLHNTAFVKELIKSIVIILKQSPYLFRPSTETTDIADQFVMVEKVVHSSQLRIYTFEWVFSFFMDLYVEMNDDWMIRQYLILGIIEVCVL